MKIKQFLSRLFTRDFTNHDGVRPVNVYLLRLVFTLTFLFVGTGAWTTIATYHDEWKPLNAVAWSVWCAYSALSVFGILRPLKMLPIVAFQIFYKVIWLTIVAYPLWTTGSLAGSAAENMTRDFLWVILPIVAMPWGYFFRVFFRKTKASNVLQTAH